MTRLNKTGFTLVELLIASAVFSVILLLATSAILQITRTYQKGLTQSLTQETARAVIEDISRTVQFSGGTVTTPITANGASKGFCVGDKRYSYLLYSQLTTEPAPPAGKSNNVLVVDSVSACNSGTLAQNLLSGGLTAGSKELLGPRMRLSLMDVSPGSTTGSWKIDLRVVSGDDDLITQPGQDACVTQTGSQFCAVSRLSTVVEKRVQ